MTPLEYLAPAFVAAVAAELDRRRLGPMLEYEEWRANLLKVPPYRQSPFPIGLTNADGD